jgi:hypothetical protein
MDVFVEWIILSAVGILFGLLPGWYSAVGVIVKAYSIENKEIPRWMQLIMRDGLSTKQSHFGMFDIKSVRTVTMVVSGIWTLCFIGGYQYLAIVDYSKGDLASIIVINASFPVFILLTWLVPMYLLTRYFERIKARDGNSTKDI